MDDMQHILLHGLSGAGKSTRIQALARHLFGPLHLETRTYPLGKGISYTCRCSEHVVELSPVLFEDRPALADRMFEDAIQRFVRTGPLKASSFEKPPVNASAASSSSPSSQSQSALGRGTPPEVPCLDVIRDVLDPTAGKSLSGDVALRTTAVELQVATPDERWRDPSRSVPSYRLFVIYNFHKMPLSVQDRMRRLMETHSLNCRFALTVESLSSVIEPIQSRSACVRVPRPTPEEAERALYPILAKGVRENLAVSDSVFGAERAAAAFLSSDADVLAETKRIVRQTNRDFMQCLLLAQLAARSERPPTLFIRQNISTNDINVSHADPGVASGQSDDNTKIRTDMADSKLESGSGRGGGSDASQLTWPWEITAFSLTTHIVLAKTSSAVTLDSYRYFIHQLLMEHAISASLVLVTLLRHLIPIPSLTSTERIAVVSTIAHYVIVTSPPFFYASFMPPSLSLSLSLCVRLCKSHRLDTRFAHARLAPSSVQTNARARS